MASSCKMLLAAAVITLLVQIAPRQCASAADGQDSKAADDLLSQLKDYEPRGTQAADDSKRWNAAQLRDALQKLSDDQLDSLLDQLPDTHYDSGGYELCLTEIIRRGGATWERLFKTRHAKMFGADNGKAAYERDSRSLQLLTAIRRVQKKEDPLAILVEGSAQIEANFASLPELRVLLANLDAERSPILVDVGGDYRGASRHNKWHILVTDVNGRRLPEREESDEGGIMRPEVVGYRESVPLTLNVGSYVSFDRPGQYRMVVMFHPSTRIGMLQNTEGLICCESLPLTLTLEPITIETNLDEQTKVAALIGKLPTTGAVHILGGRYDESVGEFLPKDSAAARLSAMEWNAVPALIKAVNGGQLNPTQRAWVFGLLFGITDQRDPTEIPGAIGEYEYRRSDWPSLNVGGKIIHQSKSSSGGPIDEQVQRELAKSWQSWLDNGVIEIKPAAGKN